jgi:aminoglycoside phosphotransferase family enzyme/predicted kinase
MAHETDYTQSELLVQALTRPEAFPHAAGEVTCVETHISWVLLAGAYAYKLKKPLELGFLDFTTLARRRAACEAELRLNRRLAPQLYLDVVPVTGTRHAPRIGGEGEALEWAVRMHRFDREQELDRLLACGALAAERIDELAHVVARFHEAAAVADQKSPWGTAEAVLRPCLANFDRLGRVANEDLMPGRLARLRAWTIAEHERLHAAFATRRARGRVRECHGDLHLANIVLHDDRVVVFDCIEFSESLRWIDVAAEIAFTLMDLHYRGRSDLAQRFLDGYLAESGDYDLLAMLDFYLVYRTMVRAKIAAIRADQPDASDDRRAAALADFRAHVALAEALIAPRSPALVITHGLSGSGKSYAAARLVERGRWVRARSDVERKRLAGLAPLAASPPELTTRLYGPDASDRTYARLAVLAETALAARFPVIIDATFLERERRESFRALAASCRVPFAILATEAPLALLRARVESRAAQRHDASEATVPVLESQLARAPALAAAELPETVRLDTSSPLDVDALEARLEAVLAQRPAAVREAE